MHNVMIENDLYDLYKRNFSGIIRHEKVVRSILGHPDNQIIEKRDSKGDLIGASVLNNNTILILCVDEGHRNRGIGSALLDESEKYLSKKGFRKVQVGAGFDYITPGVPIREETVTFFKKRGYLHSWGNCECFDMAMDFNGNRTFAKLGSTIEGIKYHFASIHDKEKVIRCVKEAMPEFVSFYQNDELYDESIKRRVLVADLDDEICGALIVELETDAVEMGSIGCTSTRPDHRHQKIATHLVEIGTGCLQEEGMKKGFLGYTYSGLEVLYGQAGYQITTKYMMAVKEL